MIAGRMAASAVQRQVRYVNPVATGSATGLVERVYAQVNDEMRLVTPPALLHSPAPRTLAAYWMLIREPLMPAVAVDRAAKEAVAAAVGIATICPYCVDMHSVSMYDLADEEDAEHLAADRLDGMRDPRLREISAWARTAHEAPAGAPMPAWVSAGQRPELIGTVVGMHYLTRVVNVFLSNFLLPPALTGRPRRRMKQGIGRLLRPTLRADREPGRSAGLLPAAPLPDDAGWTDGSPWIADAVARATAAFEAGGARSLSPAVRQLVRDRLDSWRGEETGLSTAWCEELLTGLPERDRAAGRLCLLTAVASHQVDAETVAEFRRGHPGDVALIEAVAWAAYEAARRIGARQPAAPRSAFEETRDASPWAHDELVQPAVRGVL
jgi:alkylhydroperoxidase family enzyme